MRYGAFRHVADRYRGVMCVASAIVDQPRILACFSCDTLSINDSAG